MALFLVLSFDLVLPAVHTLSMFDPSQVSQQTYGSCSLFGAIVPYDMVHLDSNRRLCYTALDWASRVFDCLLTCLRDSHTLFATLTLPY